MPNPDAPIIGAVLKMGCIAVIGIGSVIFVIATIIKAWTHG